MTSIPADRLSRDSADAAPLATAYRMIRRNVADLLGGRRLAMTAVVPSCPDWTVRDLVTHLVDVAARVNARVTSVDDSAVAGAAANKPVLVITPVERTATSVTADVPTSDAAVRGLLDRWERYAEPIDQFLSMPFSIDRGILIMDTFTHELDLRWALGVPPPIDHPARPIAMGILVKGFSAAVRTHRLPAVRIETEHGQWQAGEGVPAAVMSGPWYDVYLALSGRRSAEQIHALQWSADPAGWLSAFTWGPFTVPDAPDGAR
ncbi:maleylpyruvate isomerase family mycothiol-dependent enzyme [Solwaraspora sp. WMMB335]|uniref:maleylpyruvate isomerase family mycothiol-dependent enzyme n=1 Tax=Solwaraspora sp. WMMB335 TaxID=3404118 RepID=UPI003B93DEF3